jgi:hypothetical protein
MMVESFTIYKAGFGSICFDGGPTDTTTVDHTNSTSNSATPLLVWEGEEHDCVGVDLYPDPATKPPYGCGLNRPALITLHYKPNCDETYISSEMERSPANDGSRPQFISYYIYTIV